uniref:PH domain-containing protein n=1 Tax=Syphacia muris TaxID=451379 RepID=A0A0N5B0R7_9BILA
MEDDNALDIFKWLTTTSADGDFVDQLSLQTNAGTQIVEAKIRGNILVLRNNTVPSEPILLVLEQIHVEALNDESALFGFSVRYHSGLMKFYAEDEKQREKWMLKLSLSSHRMAQAELNEVADRYFNLVPAVTADSATNSSYSYFLTNPYSKQFKFSIPQQFNLPSRKINCEEMMWESKISLILPTQMVKLFLKWANEMKEEVEKRLWNLIPERQANALHSTIRHISSNQETYTNLLEFLESYAGPSFRPSVEKYRIAFGAVPTNLHVQQFIVEGHSYAYVTVGTASAISMRFSQGGMSRMRDSLHKALDDPERIDHILDSHFYYRRRMLLSAKSSIGILSRRIENDWRIVKFGSIDKIGVELLAEVKQLHQNLLFLINSFPGVSTLVDLLCGWSQEKATISASFYDSEKTPPCTHDTLDSQLDTLDASVISLNTKMAVLDTVQNDEEARLEYEKSAKQAINSCLDCMLQLVETLLDALYLGLITALRRSSDSQLFYHLQARSDLAFSQAVTIVTTGILVALEGKISNWIKLPLITVFSFLSCHGDEKSMLEDARDCWASLSNRVGFKFVLCSSSVTSTCVPTISGDRLKIIVQLPLLPATFQRLPDSLRSGDLMSVRVVFWNLGVNHEATLSQSIAGDSSLEKSVNILAADELQSYVNNLTNTSQNVKEIVADLVESVTLNPTNKNMTMFRLAMKVNRELSGIPVICCKSGKDRTSMAVTLEEGRLIKENCGINEDQMADMLVCLRRDGVRRENCRKNVGKPLYSFSPFQMYFIPREMRPPAGTFAAGVAS